MLAVINKVANDSDRLTCGDFKNLAKEITILLLSGITACLLYNHILNDCYNPGIQLLHESREPSRSISLHTRSNPVKTAYICTAPDMGKKFCLSNGTSELASLCGSGKRGFDAAWTRSESGSEQLHCI